MKQERESNIELLRIVCMLFIISGHIIMKYTNDSLGSIEYYISNILRSFFIVSVNCFVIITGYFGLSLNIKKLFKMAMQVWFYSVFIYFITLFLGIHKLDIKKDILFFAPIITKRYWYITVYFVLCIISPLLNIVINNLDKEKFKRLLIVCIPIFYIIPTISYGLNFPTVTSDAGYGIINFINLYFIGRYIKLYYLDNKSKIFYISIFVLSSIFLFLANHILSIIFGFYFNSFISYDTIFVLVSAYALFMLFKNIKLESKFINSLSKYAIVAYIIHMHPTFIDYLFNNIFKINNYYGFGYLLIIVLIPVVIYIGSWGIEYLRVKLFNNIEDKVYYILEEKYAKFKEK